MLGSDFLGVLELFWDRNYGLCPYVIFVGLICSWHSIEWFGLVECVGDVLASVGSEYLAGKNWEMEC